MADGTDNKVMLCAPCGTSSYSARRREEVNLAVPPQTQDEARTQILEFMRRNDKMMRTLADS